MTEEVTEQEIHIMDVWPTKNAAERYRVNMGQNL